HIQTPSPPIANFATDVPPELERLIARTLSKNPNDRPASADDLARDLEPIANGVDLRAAFRAWKSEDATRVDARSPWTAVRSGTSSPDVEIPIELELSPTGAIETLESLHER